MTEIRSIWLLARKAAVYTMLALFVASPAALADDDSDDDDDRHDSRRNCARAAVQSLDFIEAGVGGNATLCVSYDGLKGKMRLRGLQGGFAYTVWWVYIDRPDLLPGCPGGGFFDCIGTFFGADPLAVFGRMDSGVASYRGRLRLSDTLDDMHVSSGSQIWLLTFGHGPASDDKRQLARQLLTPEDPTAGAPHLGVEANGYPVSLALFERP